ncbi:hypothetical protein FRB90_010958 [Tulasnella sp. 427]|nr:hypothetical protein FRB90_010958 [Tulasnella sp. 427]
MHGAKIQCQKGKCAKAYHVSCAATSTDMVYRELGEVEQRVFMMAKKSSEVLDQATLAPAGDAEPESTGKVVKIVQKIHIETLCALHNPVAVERKKQAKADQMRQDALALQPESRIKIRATSGVYEVMVISVDSVRETVTVAWGKHRRDFSWKTVIWGDVAPGTVVKQADEVVVATIPSTSGPPSGEGPKLHAKPNQDATPPIPGTHPKSSVLVSKPAPSVYGYPYPQYPVPLHPQAIPYGSAYPYYPPPTAYTVPPPPALVPGQTPAASKSAEASKAAPQAPQWPPYNPAYYQAYPHAGAYYPPYAPYGHPHYYPPYAHFNGVPVPGQPASASLKPSPTPPTLPPSLTSPIPPSAAASVPASESS